MTDMDATDRLLEAVRTAEVRADVVQPYREALQRDDLNWSAVNHAIALRWSPSAITYIKERAWKPAAAPPPTARVLTNANGGNEPNTTPNPIPDQVLTPLSLDAWGEYHRALDFGTLNEISAAREAVEAAIRQRTIEQLRPFTTHREGCNDPSGCTCGFAAALAGVPMAAGEAVCECGHGEVEHIDVCSECFAEGPSASYDHPFKPGVVAAPVEDAK